MTDIFNEEWPKAITETERLLGAIKKVGLMQSLGWKIEQYRAFKKVGKFEVDIEFCIGDYCVGLYDENLSLLEPKHKMSDIDSAIHMGEVLARKCANSLRKPV